MQWEDDKAAEQDASTLKTTVAGQVVDATYRPGRSGTGDVALDVPRMGGRVNLYDVGTAGISLELPACWRARNSPARGISPPRRGYRMKGSAGATPTGWTWAGSSAASPAAATRTDVAHPRLGGTGRRGVAWFRDLRDHATAVAARGVVRDCFALQRFA
ncbi:hypothetical protein DDE74_34060 [Streptomyces lydicus]|uniref:Uncharacterized protein n=1 Tax=Streptomyces lydicus TaxID=47763 RepID=A0A3S9YJV3_9ACTN|nr:hypothetical protein DDE74_34060 [Streptomyces lydicus]